MSEVRTQASPEMQQVAAMMMATRGAASGLSVEQQRANMEAMQAGLTMPDGVRQTEQLIAGVPCRWFESGNPGADVLVYLHGGGYVIGSVQTHSELMARLALATGWRVVGVDYRLAPEHPYPAAVNDAVAVVKAVMADAAGQDCRIAVAGDSAGGGLTLATLLRLRDERESLPAAAVLFSPWTDLTCSSSSYASRADVDPMIVADRVSEMAALYAGSTANNHPLVSSLLADLSGLPPLLVQVGDHEVLLDDSLQLFEKARASDVDVELEVYPGAFHVFQAVPQVPEASEAVASASRFLKRPQG